MSRDKDVEITLKGKFENGKLIINQTDKLDKNISHFYMAGVTFLCM